MKDRDDIPPQLCADSFTFIRSPGDETCMYSNAVHTYTSCMRHIGAVDMTKLAQWLLGLILLGGAWVTLTFDLLDLNPPQACWEVVWPFPVYLLVAFGCYSLATIGYRLATFNDCEDAAYELQEQIHQAKKELSQRGIRF